MSKRKIEDDEALLDTGNVSPVSAPIVVYCDLIPCRHKSFSNSLEYESHYMNNHQHKCLSCKSTFPNERFLNLHIAEFHDPFNAIRKERGEKIYMCFLADCDKICSSPQKRKLHLIDKHQYPKNFLFSIVKTGLRPNQASLLKERNV